MPDDDTTPKRIGKQGRPRKPAAPRMRRAPGDPKSESLVTAVVDAAVEVLAADGHAGLTTNRVAERAGVSIGSLYQYFPNKEAIAAAVFERYLAIYVDIFVDGVQRSAGATYGELLERIIHAFAAKYRTHPQILRYLFELQSSTAMHDRVRITVDTVASTIVGLLRATGMPDTAAHEVAFVLVHSFNGCCIAIYQREIDAVPIAERFIAMTRLYLQQLGIDDARA